MVEVVGGKSPPWSSGQDLALSTAMPRVGQLFEHMNQYGETHDMISIVPMEPVNDQSS